MLDEYIAQTEKPSDYFSRAIIAPHAGYIFSGRLAVEAYKYLNPAAKNIFIISPAHYERITGCVISDYDEWETPLGVVNVNTELTQTVAQCCDCSVNNAAFEKEHAVEVHIPIIRKMFPHAQIVPLIYGSENPVSVAKVIASFWNDKDNAFVISSDLSHFYPEAETRKIDNYTAKMIENGEIENFAYEQACGTIGITGLVRFANDKRWSMIRVGMTDSAARTGDYSRVVGYGSWFLYEGNKNEYIKKYFSDFVLDVCRNSIGDPRYEPPEHPAVFDEDGACFVTLEKNCQLCGCIGSIIAHQPLIDDLVNNARCAAFRDPRFEPLTREEFEHLDISVSLLTKPEKMTFTDEQDLLNQLVPNRDGLIISDNGYQSVFLPVVWEQLPDKHEFMEHLKLKAGLRPDHFSETFEARRFYAVKI